MVEALIEQATPWLTPTSLFLLLNLVIATIFFSNHRSSSSAATTTAPPHTHTSTPLTRAPSLFSRVTSFNLSNYHPNPEPQPQPQPESQPEPESAPSSFFSRVASFNFSGRAHDEDADRRIPEPEQERERETKQEVKRELARAPSLLSRVASFTLGQVQRVEVGEVDAHYVSKPVKKGKKKMKTKGVGVERFETASLRNEEERHHQVDAKADDFINRFKQQLKLQRIESLMRYRSA